MKHLFSSFFHWFASSRSELQILLGLIGAAFMLALPVPGGAQENLQIVDTHVHFWDLQRPKGIYWISKDDQVLYRSLLPAVHEPIAKANHVRGVIVVQAGQSLPDNQWNLDITAHNKQLYRGVVGNLSEVIGTDKFKPLFKQLCKDKRYVGYRLSGKYQENLSEEFFRDLELTANSGKTVDFLIGGYTLEEVKVIAQRVPKLKIILDHFGNVKLDDQALNLNWVKQFRAVAKFKNVYCKVSALYGRAKQQPAPRDLGFYRPVLDLAVECFGEDRIVFGSDWPVTRTTGDYASIVELTREYFDSRGPGMSEKLFYRNALRFYGIESSSNSSDLDPQRQIKE